MIAKTVEDLHLYQRARELVVAVTAILQWPAFERDLDLRDQIRRAADSVVSNIAEGFAQPTDRAFAGYLFHAKGSNAEVRARLRLACDRRYLTDAEVAECDRLADQVAAMTTGLVNTLSAATGATEVLAPVNQGGSLRQAVVRKRLTTAE